MKRNINLRDAIPQTPDMCRKAVLHAVGTYREKKRMVRPYKVILAVAAALVLLGGTALAIVNYYSVREYVAQGTTSETFENAIVPLNKGKESNGITLTMGDAVFDGRTLGFTMEMEAKENADSLYLLTHLEAYHEGENLDLNNYQAEGFDYCWGLIYPYLETEYSHQLPNRFGVSAEVNNAPVGSEITWRFTVQMLKPLGKLVNQEGWNEEQTYRQWKTIVQDMKEKGEIAVYGGRSISDYLDALGVGGEEKQVVDMIMETNMFEKLETLEFEFSTPVPERVNLAPDAVFVLDGYTMTVKYITTSMMQVDYEMVAYYDKPQAHEHDLEQFWRLFDQNGQRLMNISAQFSLAEDKRTCTIEGHAMRISDEPLTEITFSQAREYTPEIMNGESNVPSFTVKLTK